MDCERFAKVFLELADAMKDRQVKLVYGGGDWGLMGATARAVIANGGSVHGVVPEFMKVSAGEFHGETVFVETMAERKAQLAEAVIHAFSITRISH
jgi:predicted Rossmann-fold nucleotide-binding protein